MKTNNNDKLWNGEPWDDELISQLPRPSADTREKIYSMARDKVSDATVSIPIFSFSKIFRGRFSYALWGAAASILILFCVWLGTTGRGFYNSYQVSNDVNNMVDHVVSILNEPDFSPLTEQNGVDIDEAIMVVELQTVNEELASLENNLQLSYLF